MHITTILTIFLSGFSIGLLTFFVLDNRNSILRFLRKLQIENYNLKKDIKSKNDFINALLDGFCEQGLIDEAEKMELQIKQKMRTPDYDIDSQLTNS